MEKLSVDMAAAEKITRKPRAIPNPNPVIYFDAFKMKYPVAPFIVKATLCNLRNHID